MPLSDTKARSAKPGEKPYQLPDHDGLYLDVRPSGRKVWRVRLWLDGKEIRHTVGDYPDIGLQSARQKRDVAKQQARNGINPNTEKAEKKQASRYAAALTVKSVSLEWLEKTGVKRGAKYQEQIRRVLAADVYPAIGDMPISSVKPIHVLGVLQSVEGRGSKCVAINIRMWLSTIFRYAIITQRCETDPAATLRGVIERDPVQHSRALNKAELAEFIHRLRNYKGNRTVTIAIELIMMLFARTAEVRKARWDEFDLESAEWRIPADRMKMKRPHIVPLPRQAIALLQELHIITGNCPVLFPSTRNINNPVHATTYNTAILYMGYERRELSMHDFRATASTLLYESGKYRAEVIERQMAHAERNQSIRPYNHAEYLPERRQMMQDYADMLESLSVRTI
ncbi:integrase arm-type DNA-binding domain-containing protein [Candidatus Thiothrix sp. Deng01]|uniref:Integrase arm-type DNA-binding domain-containing protein n=1 Tax=Candidatus Thiothrix phosphatis TaxID=3112415 RepID=A0ABU6CUK1_9GAMM|nr:integrase arm-type DNA-binding domain-containing protein [Candidatus Thiothrix sp. Deng01]MEB4590506.1 integrase arm-type DNA-binding domain-containing protein [Candidatus Thiothrix sp. Deng01]